MESVRGGEKKGERLKRGDRERGRDKGSERGIEIGDIDWEIGKRGGGET